MFELSDSALVTDLIFSAFQEIRLSRILTSAS